MAKNNEQTQNPETENETVDTPENDSGGFIETGVVSAISIGSISAKPRPSLDEKGKPETVDWGNGNFKVLYVEQDLATVTGEARGFGFVETDKGESLVLHGSFRAVRHVPDHNGEFDVLYTSSECILPTIAEKELIKHLDRLKLPLSMAQAAKVGEVTTSDKNTKRSAIFDFPEGEKVTFAFLIGAKGAPTVTGYQYTIRSITKASKVKDQADMLLDAALERRKSKQKLLA